MNTLEALETRRSCRAYTSEPVAPELIDQIIEAGTYAPTGMGRQSPIIVAITNKEVRDRLSRINARVMGSEDDPFYGAPAVLVVLARKDVQTFDNQAGMSKQGDSPDYECRLRLREHAVRSNLLSRTLPTPPSIP